MSFNRESGVQITEQDNEESLTKQFLLEKEELEIQKKEIRERIDKKKNETKLNLEEKELRLEERELELIESNRKIQRLVKRLNAGKALFQSLQQENENFKKKIDLLSKENILLHKENNTLVACVRESLISHEQMLAEFYTAMDCPQLKDDTQNQVLELHLSSLAKLENEIEVQKEEVKNLEKYREEQDKSSILNHEISSLLFEEYQRRQLNEESARKLLDEKLAQQAEQLTVIKQIFDETQEGDDFEKLSESLQTKFAAEQERSQAIQLKLLELEAREDQLEEKSEPVLSKYQLEEKKEVIRKQILTNPKTRLFYNTFYQNFSAKIVAAILLTSDLIKHNERLADSMTDFGAALTENVISNALPIPVIGAVLATMAGRAIKSIGGNLKHNVQIKKVQHTADSVIAFDLATELASLTACQLTLHYENVLHSTPDENIKQAAEYCAHSLYNFIKAGSLLSYKDETTDEKVKILLNEAQAKCLMEEGLHPPKNFMARLFHKNSETEGEGCEIEEKDLPSYEEIFNKFQLEKSHSVPTVVNNIHNHYANSSGTVRDAKGKAEFALKHSAVTQENVNRMLKNQSKQITTQQEKIAHLEKENSEQKKRLTELSEQVASLSGLVQSFTPLFTEKGLPNQIPTTEKKIPARLHSTKKSISSTMIPTKQSLFPKSTSQKDESRFSGFLRLKSNSSKFKVGSV